MPHTPHLKDYYAVLQVRPAASADEIKRAFRALALAWHPDRHPPYKKPAAHRAFIAVAEAYEILRDPQERRIYDRLHAEAFGAKAAPVRRARPPQPEVDAFVRAAQRARQAAMRYAKEPLTHFARRIGAVVGPAMTKGVSAGYRALITLLRLFMYAALMYAAVVLTAAIWYASPVAALLFLAIAVRPACALVRKLDCIFRRLCAGQAADRQAGDEEIGGWG